MEAGLATSYLLFAVCTSTSFDRFCARVSICTSQSGEPIGGGGGGGSRRRRKVEVVENGETSEENDEEYDEVRRLVWLNGTGHLKEKMIIQMFNEMQKQG